MRRYDTPAETELDQYLRDLVEPETPALQNITDQLKKDEKWGINIGIVEGQILQWLIHALRVKTVVEIGTQYGFSTQKMLQALPGDGKIISIEKDLEHYKRAQELNKDGRVQFLLGDAVPILESLTGDFDLIFIDANKNAYVTYLDWAMNHVKPGGLIIGDNTFLFGQVFKNQPPEDKSEKMWATMREFNRRLFSDGRFATCIIPTQEGLTIGLRK